MRVVNRTLSAVTTYAPAASSVVAKINRFVIVAPGRCGSELLVDLLRSQPAVACDGEVLKGRVRMPRAFLTAHAQRARRRGAEYYGCKLLVGQLEDVQGLADPAKFIARLDARGWLIVGLMRRNLLRQSLSWLWAAHRDEYHQRVGASPTTGAMTVDPQELITMMFLHEIANDFVTSVVDAASHSLRLVYEDDLEHGERHQRTVDKVMQALGGRSAPAATRLQPTGGQRISERIANFDEVARAVRETKFAGLVRDDG